MTFATYFNPGVSLQGGSGSGSGTASLPISGNGATITANTPLVNGTQTWNNAGVTFTGLLVNVTDTASNSASLLMDLQIGGSSRLSVRKDGFINVGGSAASIYVSGLGLSYAGSGLLSFGAASDVILGRRAAANLRFGAADAAAPVAQTLSVQSVIAGTTNTAGTNLTITGSQGTGSGVGGDIIFQVAPAGAAPTVQNTLATALRVYNNRTVAVGAAYTVATLPAAGTQGRRAWVTDATVPTFLGTLTGGGAVVCPVFDNGTAWVSA